MARQSEALTVQPAQEDKDWEAIEQLVMTGNIAGLNPAQRMRYYEHQCKRLGVDPESQALQYIKLGGRLTLYIGKGATDQIARNLKISRRIVRTERMGDVYIVTAEAFDHTGRVDQSTGALLLADRNGTQFAGDELVNALLKCESKAKRRATISFCGLGFLDETEVETIKGAEQVSIREAHTDKTTGEMPPRRVTVHEPPSDATPDPVLLERLAEREKIAAAFFATLPIATPPTQDAALTRYRALGATLASDLPDPTVLASPEIVRLVEAAAADLTFAGAPQDDVPVGMPRGYAWDLFKSYREELGKLRITGAQRAQDKALSYAAAG